MTKQYDTAREAVRQALKYTFQVGTIRVPGARPSQVHIALLAQGWKGVPLPEQSEWHPYLNKLGFKETWGLNARGIKTKIVTAIQGERS